MPVSLLRVTTNPVGVPDTEVRGDLRGSFRLRDYEVHYRPPNTDDVAKCAELESAASRQKLLASCVTDARCQGRFVTAEELPDDVVRKVIEQIAASDPQADMRLDLVCPECHGSWREVFDIVSFFWIEIDAWARRILREVNVLARAYGWRESDILELSPIRRQVYLSMIQAQT